MTARITVDTPWGKQDAAPRQPEPANDERVARTCANFEDAAGGYCLTCGNPADWYEVAPAAVCPAWRARQ